MQIERQGVPAVVFNAERFAPLALAQREMLGSHVPIVFLPDPLKGRDPDEIRSIADEKYTELLAHVTAARRPTAEPA